MMQASANGIVIFLIMIIGLLLMVPVILIFVGIYIHRYCSAKKSGVAMSAISKDKNLFSGMIGIVVFYIIVVLTGVLAVYLHATKPELSTKANFTLQEDVYYGDFLIPKGATVLRDIYTSAETKDIPNELRRLESVRFFEPVTMRGLQVSAMELYPLRLELAEDAWIEPVYKARYDAKGKGLIWEEDHNQKAVECRRGDVAYFVDLAEETDITYQKEIGGREAHFVPEEWLFVKCETNYLVTVPDPKDRKTQERWRLHASKVKVENPLQPSSIEALDLYYTAMHHQDPERFSQAVIALERAFVDDPTLGRTLGWIYESGDYLPQNLNKAQDWYQQACIQGDTYSCEKLLPILLDEKK